MENINNKIKKRQIILFSAVVFGALLIILVGIIYFRLQNGDIKFSGEKEKEKEKDIPQLVGVVNHTFDEKYTTNALKDNQTLGRELDRKYESLQKEVKRKDQEIIKLQQQLSLQQENIKVITDSYDKRLNELEKRKPGNSYNIDVGNNGKSGNSNQMNPEEIEGYGELARPAPVIVTTRVNSELLEEKSNLPYIPSGSFAEAIIIEGADANASVTGNNNTDPIQFRIIGKIQMPNDQEYDLTGCFVTAEVYGDISSERGKARTRTISCKSEDNDDEKTIDMKIKGHVAYAGKNGIKGIPVMRNGHIVAWAGAAGLLDGFGKGAESASGKTVGIGATSDASGGDILKSALGGGVSKASSTLSDYYIKRAEQYHPVIDIGAGNLVTIVFQDGFQLEYKEDLIKKENIRNSNNNNNVNNKDLLSAADPYNSHSYPNLNMKKQPFSETTNTSSTNTDIENQEDNQDINLNNEQSIESLKDIYLQDYIKENNND